MAFIKHFLIMACLLGVIAGCGQKSKVTPSVEAKTTAEQYGDGKHVIRRFVVPMGDQMIDKFDSPLQDVLFPLAGGFAKLFMNFGTSIGMGRSQMSLFQPVPTVSKEYVKHLSMKRLFFFIEPTEGKREYGFFRRLLNGNANVDFKFLDKLAIKISPHRVQNVRTWQPHFESRDIRNGEYTPLQSLFEGVQEDQIFSPVEDPNKLKDLVVIKYSNKSREKFLRNSDFGPMYIISTKRPIETKWYLEDHPRMKNFFSSIHVVHGKKPVNHPEGDPVPGTLIVELDKDPVVEEQFKNQISEEAERQAIEDFGVDNIEACEEWTCMDLGTNNVDLLPLIMRGNAIKIDTFLDVKKVPESFQLKGFVEFELKMHMDF